MSCWATSFRVPLVYPTLQKNERIAAPGVSQIRFQLFLSRADPRCVVFLRYPRTLMAQQNRDSFDGNSSTFTGTYDPEPCDSSPAPGHRCQNNQRRTRLST